MPDIHYPRSWKKSIERSRELRQNPTVNLLTSNFPILDLSINLQALR